MRTAGRSEKSESLPFFWVYIKFMGVYKKDRAASTTALSRFHYKLYLTKLKPHSYILTNP